MGCGGGMRGSCRVGAVLLFTAWIALAALSRLLRPVPNGCVMTYMYPTYIPIAAAPRNVSSDRYGLFLYHEGWKQIDFDKHIRGLNGVPVLFIPGNGGSYKQVRSLAAESLRAYQNGPLEPTFYQEASSTFSKDELDEFSVPTRYRRMLDWFAVDLEGEHSAMDGRILEEHTEYVVYAIHRILDQYKESHLERSKGIAQSSDKLPSSVILVGHSMGGFVARAALVHPNLRKSAVETILTLSSPHQYPPIALQPSLGQFFTHVNEEWRRGYKMGGPHAASPKLSNVIVVSISGGIHDYQVRSRLTLLDGIVPSTHGFMVESSSMKNVWLSMDHQSILWCNQLVVQVSHTLLSIIDPVNGKPFSSTQKRVIVFAKMLQSSVPQSLSWMSYVPGFQHSNLLASDNPDARELQQKDLPSCPPSVQWASDGLEKDLYIQSNSVTVLAMDGRRRWLDIKKLMKDICAKIDSAFDVLGRKILDMQQIRAGDMRDLADKMEDIAGVLSAGTLTVEVNRSLPPLPPTTQLALQSVVPVETPAPQPQTEIAVAEVSPLQPSYVAAQLLVQSPGAMAVPAPAPEPVGTADFVAVKCGGGNLSMDPISPLKPQTNQTSNTLELPPYFLLSAKQPSPPSAPLVEPGSQTEQPPPSAFLLLSPEQMNGFRFITISVAPRPVFSCDIPVLFKNVVGAIIIHMNTERLLLVLNFRIQTISGRPPPAASMAVGQFFDPEEGTIALSVGDIIRSSIAPEEMFLPEDHPLALNLSFSVSLGLLPVKLSLKTAGCGIKNTGDQMEAERNKLCKLRCFPPVALAWDSVSGLHIVPNINTETLVVDSSPAFWDSPEGTDRTTVLVLADPHCSYKATMRASPSAAASRFFLLYSSEVNGALCNQSLDAVYHWQSWEDTVQSAFLRQLLTFSLSFQSLKSQSLKWILLSCNSFLAASFRSINQKKDVYKSSMGDNPPILSKSKPDGVHQLLPMDDSPKAAKSFTDSQLELFDCRHGIMILHLLTTVMFAPSLVAWLQRIGMGQNFPWFVDSFICVGVILHGLLGSQPNVSCISFKLPGRRGGEVGLSFLYLLGGYYSFVNSMALAPYRALYASAIIGFICFASRIIERRKLVRGDISSRKSRKHSHRH
ncbi:hypothetical protein EJB05_44622 [Eragrostis curvula]|uniref:GPI inositol-deacylase n=1 Tax=Eragrostis curvula TaxID=38414 RepID=A0A5J9TI58_9POAL|nr:hypothetical protein EJB05_44622 [Eragrostis curvula]